MSDVLKKYSIVIGADTKELMTELNKAEKELTKKLDNKDLGAGVRESIEKLVKEIGTMRSELKTATKDINNSITAISTDSLKNEFGGMQKIISADIQGLQTKIEGLQGTIDALNQKGGLKNLEDGLVGTFSNIEKKMNDIMDEFKTFHKFTQDFRVGAFDTSALDRSLKQNEATLNKTSKSMKKEFSSLLDRLDTDMVSDIRINGVDESNIKDAEHYLSIMLEIQNIMSKMDSESVVSVLNENNIGIDSESLKKQSKALRSDIDNFYADIRDEIQGQTPDIYLRWKTEINPNETAQDIIDKIDKEYTNKVQKHLENKPLKFKTEIDKKDLENVVSNAIKEENNLLKAEGAPKIKIGLDIEGLDKSKLNEVSSSLSEKVKEIQAGDVNVSGGNLNLSSDDLAQESTLSEIKDILTTWNGSGIPGTQSKEQIQQNHQTQTNLKNAGYLLRGKFRGRVSEEEIKNAKLREEIIADREYLTTMLEEMKRLKTIGKRMVKNPDLLHDSELYKASTIVDKVEYAKWSPKNITLDEWQTELNKALETGIGDYLKTAIKSIKGMIAKKTEDLNELGVEFDKDGKILARNTVAIGENEVYKAAYGKASSLKNEAFNNGLQKENNRLELLKLQRTTMQQIVELANKQASTDLSKEEEEKLNSLKEQLRIITQVTSDEEKFNALLKEETELQNKMNSNKLDSKGFDRLMSIRQEMSTMWIDASNDMVEFSRQSLSSTDTQLSQIDNDIAQQQAKVNKFISNYRKGFAQIQRETFGDEIKNDDDYERKLKEWEANSKELTVLRNSITKVDSKGNITYDMSALLDSEKERYWHLNNSASKLGEQLELYRELKNLQAEVTGETKKENEVVVSKNKRLGEAKKLISSIYTHGGGDSESQNLSLMSVEELQDLSTKLGNVVDSASVNVDKKLELKAHLYIDERIKFLEKQLSYANDSIKELTEKGADTSYWESKKSNLQNDISILKATQNQERTEKDIIEDIKTQNKLDDESLAKIKSILDITVQIEESRKRIAQLEEKSDFSSIKMGKRDTKKYNELKSELENEVTSSTPIINKLQNNLARIMREKEKQLVSDVKDENKIQELQNEENRIRAKINSKLQNRSNIQSEISKIEQKYATRTSTSGANKIQDFKTANTELNDLLFKRNQMFEELPYASKNDDIISALHNLLQNGLEGVPDSLITEFVNKKLENAFLQSTINNVKSTENTRQSDAEMAASTKKRVDAVLEEKLLQQQITEEKRKQAELDASKAENINIEEELLKNKELEKQYSEEILNVEKKIEAIRKKDSLSKKQTKNLNEYIDKNKEIASVLESSEKTEYNKTLSKIQSLENLVNDLKSEKSRKKDIISIRKGNSTVKFSKLTEEQQAEFIAKKEQEIVSLKEKLPELQEKHNQLLDENAKKVNEILQTQEKIFLIKKDEKAAQEALNTSQQSQKAYYGKLKEYRTSFNNYGTSDDTIKLGNEVIALRNKYLESVMTYLSYGGDKKNINKIFYSAMKDTKDVLSSNKVIENENVALKRNLELKLSSAKSTQDYLTNLQNQLELQEASIKKEQEYINLLEQEYTIANTSKSKRTEKSDLFAYTTKNSVFKGMSDEQKMASFKVDYQLDDITKLLNKQEKIRISTGETSNEYLEITKQIDLAKSRLENFRNEAVKLGLTISQTTGRAILDSSKESTVLYKDMFTGVSEHYTRTEEQKKQFEAERKAREEEEKQALKEQKELQDRITAAKRGTAKAEGTITSEQNKTIDSSKFYKGMTEGEAELAKKLFDENGKLFSMKKKNADYSEEEIANQKEIVKQLEKQVEQSERLELYKSKGNVSNARLRSEYKGNSSTPSTSFASDLPATEKTLVEIKNILTDKLGTKSTSKTSEKQSSKEEKGAFNIKGYQEVAKSLGLLQKNKKGEPIVYKKDRDKVYAEMDKLGVAKFIEEDTKATKENVKAKKESKKAVEKDTSATKKNVSEKSKQTKKTKDITSTSSFDEELYKKIAKENGWLTQRGTVQKDKRDYTYLEMEKQKSGSSGKTKEQLEELRKKIKETEVAQKELNKEQSKDNSATTKKETKEVKKQSEAVKENTKVEKQNNAEKTTSSNKTNISSSDLDKLKSKYDSDNLYAKMADLGEKATLDKNVRVEFEQLNSTSNEYFNELIKLYDSTEKIIQNQATSAADKIKAIQTKSNIEQELVKFGGQFSDDKWHKKFAINSYASFDSDELIKQYISENKINPRKRDKNAQLLRKMVLESRNVDISSVIKDTFKGDASKVASTYSKDTLQKFIDGAKAETPEMKKAFTELAKIPEETIRQALQINSPSEIMKKLGFWTVEGLAVGITENADKVRKALEDAIKNGTVSVDELNELSGYSKTRQRSLSYKNIYQGINGLDIKSLLASQTNDSQAIIQKLLETSNKAFSESGLSSMFYIDGKAKNQKDAAQYIKENTEEVRIALEEYIRVFTESGLDANKTIDDVFADIFGDKHKTVSNAYASAISKITPTTVDSDSIDVELKKEIEKTFKTYESKSKKLNDISLSIENGNITNKNLQERAKLTEEVAKLEERINGYRQQSISIEQAGFNIEEKVTELSKKQEVHENNLLTTKLSGLDISLAQLQNAPAPNQAFIQHVNQLASALSRLHEFSNSSFLNAEEANEAKNLFTSIKNTINELNSLNGKEITTLIDQESVKQSLESMQGIQKETIKIYNNGTKISGVIKEANGVSKTLEYTWNDVLGCFVKSNVQLTNHISLWTALKNQVKKSWSYFKSYFSGYMVAQRIISTVRQGITYIKELDSALIEMKKVSDESTESLLKFQKQSFDTAKSIGATGVEIQNSAADFMRLGYSLQEASQLAKDANIYANVGDMEINEATEHMISSIQAWQSEFSSATEASTALIDKYNEIGNNYAITSADIGSAMERSAAALKVAGNSLDESIGLITAGNLIQQDADTTANALKVMSLRIRGSKTELEDMGEETDNLASSTSKLRNELQALTGVDIMYDDNTYKSTAKIIQEIGAVWDTLDDVSQANTLEKLAGKTRASTVAGLIENYETIDKVANDAAQAQGSALKENQEYIDGIEGRTAQLTTQVQEFWHTFIESDTIKNGITLLTDLLNLLTKFVDTFGALGSATIIGSGIFGAKNIGRPKKFGLVLNMPIIICVL